MFFGEHRTKTYFTYVAGGVADKRRKMAAKEESPILGDSSGTEAVPYFFLETVRKPLRGFSFTTRSAGRSTGVPFAFFSTFAKK